MCWTRLSLRQPTGTAAGPGAEVWHKVCQQLLCALGRVQQHSSRLVVKTCCSILNTSYNILNTSWACAAPALARRQRGFCALPCLAAGRAWRAPFSPQIVPNSPAAVLGTEQLCEPLEAFALPAAGAGVPVYILQDVLCL